MSSNEPIFIYSKECNSFDLYNNIMALDDNEIFSDKYFPELPHPIDILNKNFSDVTASLTSLQKVNSDTNSADIPNQVFNFVSRAAIFYDNMANIIITLKNPKENELNAKDTHRLLDSAKHEEWRRFKGTTLERSKFISNINNILKHGTAFIIPIKLTYYDNNTSVIGFYIGKEDKSGYMQPVESIHPKWDGMRTGISLNYLIKNTITSLYFYCDALNTIFFNKKNRTSSINNPHIYQPAFQCLSCNNNFFPNEYGMICGNFTEENGIVSVAPRAKAQRLPFRKKWNVNQLYLNNPRVKAGSAGMLYYKF